MCVINSISEQKNRANVVIIIELSGLLNETISAHVSTLLWNKDYFNDNGSPFSAPGVEQLALYVQICSHASLFSPRANCIPFCVRFSIRNYLRHFLKKKFFRLKLWTFIPLGIQIWIQKLFQFYTYLHWTRIDLSNAYNSLSIIRVNEQWCETNLSSFNVRHIT